MKKTLSDIAEDIVAYNLEDLGDVEEFAITREGFKLYTEGLLELGMKAGKAAHAQGIKQGLLIGVGLSAGAYLYTKVKKSKQETVEDMVEE